MKAGPHGRGFQSGLGSNGEKYASCVGRVYTVWLNRDEVWMVDIELSLGLGSGPRRRRSAAERRRVVEETLEAGASVARVALKHGVNANQVFQWRRACIGRASWEQRLRTR